MAWRFADTTVLHWRHLDGDWLIYDEGSGQTLCASPVVAAALMALESGCTALPAIETQALADLGCEPGVDLHRALVEGLGFLEQLGLIEAVSP